MRQKEQQLQEWEHEFHQKEMEFLSKEEYIREQYNKNLLETRSDLENQYSTSMQQLRTDLDEDYQQQLRRLEASLNDHYGGEIGQLKALHQEQVLWWKLLLVLKYCYQINVSIWVTSLHQTLILTCFQFTVIVLGKGLVRSCLDSVIDPCYHGMVPGTYFEVTISIWSFSYISVRILMLLIYQEVVALPFPKQNSVCIYLRVLIVFL